MKTVWYKIKSSVWWLVSLVVLSIGMLWFLYNLVRPTENKAEFMENAQTKVHTAIKENEIRAKLEKDKIGAIKKIYDQKLKETKEIQDREERLRALIRLHNELDL
jgi:flagellar biosynthesis/type III secretory pathway M-ring protein FliF/YscJ